MVVGLRCGRCGIESPAGKRFCGDCGAPLGARCPACGAEADGDKRFCGDCGHELNTAAPAADSAAAVLAPQPVAQRRQCSVVFVDLVGFTVVAEGRDPEEVRELLSQYFDRASTVVARYGGVVEKFIGDAVMAVWGTPVATEQDAERAVRAALDLVDTVTRLGSEIGVDALTARAGVLTGEVAVTVGATNEGMVAGDAVNTAARIQAVAPPGTVFVDAVTRRLTEVAVAYRAEGEHELKGKASPEQLWRAERVLSNVGGAQRIDDLDSPLVGRAAELRAIRDMFHLAVERRRPRMMTLTGLAGVGKSRLGWEFDNYIDGLADVVYWHRGRCLSYGDGLTYWAIAEAVRQRLNVAEEDPPAVVVARIGEALGEHVADAGERDHLAVRLGRLLGVTVAGDNGQHLTTDDLHAGWRRFFEHLARRHPVVVLIEDAHHAAPELLEFVDHLVDWAHDLPIFVLVMARPEIADVRPGFGVGRDRAHLALEPLDDASIEVLVGELAPELPVDVRARIVDRAQGIPLYAIESVRSLIDRRLLVLVDGVHIVAGDLSHLEVPETLTSLLAARIDSLDPTARRIVADAAVLGSSFPAEAIAAITDVSGDALDDALRELVRRSVFEVSADRLSPERGNYRFGQEMLRQVAYETLSRRDRKARHLSVAAHLRATFPNDGEEVIDAIARHYLDACDAVIDDDDRPEVEAMAVDALVRAARRAARTGAPTRAISSYDQAATRLLAAGDPLRAAELWMDAAAMGRVTTRNRNLARPALAAMAIYDERGMAREAARARMQAGRALRREGQLTEARRLLDEAWEVVGDERSIDTLEATNQFAMIETFAGDVPSADRWTQLALDLVHELGLDGFHYAFSVDGRGIFYGMTGQALLGSMYIREALRVYEQIGDLNLLAQAYANLNNLLNTVDPPEGVVVGERGLALCTEFGLPALGAFTLVNLAWSHLAVGNWDETARLLYETHTAAVAADDLDLRSNQAIFAALRGDDDLPERRERLAALDDSEDPQDISALAAIAMHEAIAAGDAEAALERAMVCVELLDRELPFGSDDGRWVWPTAARLAHQTGRHDVVEELIGRYRAVAAGAVAPMQRAEAALIEARLAASAGEPDADDRFAAAIAAQRELSTPFHLAHGLVDHAEHLGAGHPLTAAALDEADEIAARLRCMPLATRSAAVRRRISP